MGKWQAALVALSLSFAMTSAHAQDVVTVSLVAKDGKFEPATIEVPAGKRIKIEVSNEGKTPIEFESKDLKQEKVIPPRGKGTLNVSPLKPGEYAYLDDFDQSSRGKLVAR